MKFRKETWSKVVVSVPHKQSIPYCTNLLNGECLTGELLVNKAAHFTGCSWSKQAFWINPDVVEIHSLHWEWL